MGRHSFRIVSGESTETKRNLCHSSKFLHQEIRWNYGIFCSISNNGEIGVFIFFIRLDYFHLIKSSQIWLLLFCITLLEEVFFAPCFTIFGMNIWRFTFLHLPIEFKYGKIQTRKNFKFWHFSHNKSLMNFLFAYKLKQSNGKSNEPVKCLFLLAIIELLIGYLQF